MRESRTYGSVRGARGNSRPYRDEKWTPVFRQKMRPLKKERLEVLDARIAERGIDRGHYAWYRDLRRYGTVPHAGFGLGFERTLAYVTGLANVRDAIPFPRTPGNARY